MTTYNIVELCKTTDKNSQSFVTVAQDQGYDVYNFRGNYVLCLVTLPVWRAGDVSQITLKPGLYVFKD